MAQFYLVLKNLISMSGESFLVVVVKQFVE